VHTSMGLTPLVGRVMGTRSGDIDAGAVTFIMDKLGLDTKGISDLLNKKSGLAGVSCLSNDLRDIMAAAREGDEKARLVNEMYTYRIKKYIGQYAAAMGGVDIILFTGGAGENQWEVRAAATEGLEYMGVKMDDARNRACRAVEAVLSADDSRVTVCCIPTDEELMIALDTQALC
ncbi:MAG: acetate kinase, partial [Bacteroidaceae bacterium]|nr:acetate kinase [Bacteroidaceae bacterium]